MGWPVGDPSTARLRFDVLIHPEEIVRVPPGLHLDESVVTLRGGPATGARNSAFPGAGRSGLRHRRGRVRLFRERTRVTPPIRALSSYRPKEPTKPGCPFVLLRTDPVRPDGDPIDPKRVAGRYPPGAYCGCGTGRYGRPCPSRSCRVARTERTVVEPGSCGPVRPARSSAPSRFDPTPYSIRFRRTRPTSAAERTRRSRLDRPGALRTTR